MRKGLVVSVAALAAVSLALSACGDKSSTSSSSSGSGSSGGATSGSVALLLPESKTARYESQDKPLFEAKFKSLCPGCNVIYSNADQDASKQQSQADAAITNGAKVLVLDPVDAASASSIVTKANAQGVKVVSYDRLVKNAPVDYYVSFDNKKVGQIQGESLLKALQAGGDPKRGQIVMINGSPTDSNAAEFKAGAHSALDGKVNIGKEYDTPDWSNDKAQQEMDQAITALGKDKIIGVYAANDGTAGGAIAAMKAAGFSPLPPVTGQDAELAGIQRVLAGDQYMTVYKAIKPEAEKAAQVAYDLLSGKSVGNGDTTKNNGNKDVPSTLFDPKAVTKDDVKSTVIADGFWTAQQICTPAYASACSAAGIS